MKKNNFILIIIIVLVVFGMTISLQSFLLAWTEPTLPPPGGAGGLAGKWDESPIDVNDIYYDAGQVGIATDTIPANLALNVDGRIGATEYCNESGDNCKSSTEIMAVVEDSEGDSYVYLTTNTHQGDLGGSRAAIDNICETEMPSTLSCSNVHALLTVSEDDEIRDMPSNYGYDETKPIYWYNSSTQGATQFADTWSDMLDGTIAVNQDTGTGDSSITWSGSLGDGSLDLVYSNLITTCYDWADDDNARTANISDPYEVSSEWLASEDVFGAIEHTACNTNFKLRCMCEYEEEESDRFFLLTNNQYTGDLQQEAIDLGYTGTSGILGANEVCHYEVNTYDFKGKNGRYFPEEQVKAFICNDSGCNNLLPDTKYTMAHIGSATAGGWTFVTNGSGQGPNDYKNWSDGDAFSTSGNIWTNRANNTDNLWANTNQSTNMCSNLESIAGNSPVSTLDSTDRSRWYNIFASTSCSTNQYIICAVEGAGSPGGGAWEQNGSDLYYTGGNVGIKTDSPTHELVVKDDTGNSGIYVWGDSQNAEIALGDGSDHWAIYNDVTGTDDLRFWNNTPGNLLTLTNEGNVGIGNTSPSELFHVAGGSRFDGEVCIGCNAQGSNLSLRFGKASGIAFSSETNIIARFGNGSDDGLFFYRGGNLGVGMVLLDNGNVGIGISDPSEKLEVDGNIRTIGLGVINDSGTASMMINAPTNNDSVLKLSEGYSDKWLIYNDGDNSDNLVISNAVGTHVLEVEQGGGVTGLELSCTTRTCSSGGDASCTVNCQGSEIMTGGGTSAGWGQAVWLHNSYPNGNGWTCYLDDSSHTCYVRCCTIN